MNVYRLNKPKSVLIRQVNNICPKARKVDKPKVCYMAASNPNGNGPKGPSIYTKFINADFIKKIAEKYKNICNSIK